jgi:hypothetical protein
MPILTLNAACLTGHSCASVLGVALVLHVTTCITSSTPSTGLSECRCAAAGAILVMAAVLVEQPRHNALHTGGGPLDAFINTKSARMCKHTTYAVLIVLSLLSFRPPNLGPAFHGLLSYFFQHNPPQ